MADDTCPECGHSDHQQEQDENALHIEIEVLHADAAKHNHIHLRVDGSVDSED